MREMDYKTFRELAAEAASVPVFRRMVADTWTPVHVYLTLAATRQGTPSFLLESAAGPEKIGRYSFLGFGPYGGVCHGIGDQANPDFLQQVRREMDRRRAASVPGLPRFTGGAVGYMAYDCVRLFEEKVPVWRSLTSMTTSMRSSALAGRGVTSTRSSSSI